MRLLQSSWKCEAHREMLPVTPVGLAAGMSTLTTRANKRVRYSTELGPIGRGDKVLHLMRHGVTEMNVYLSKNKYGSKGFRDPLLYDTKLTERGRRGAAAAAARVRQLQPSPELLVVSPLSRALQTASLAFGEEPGCPVVVEPLVRERLYLSSDVGSQPHQLTEAWPQFDFDHLPRIWWHHDGSGDPLAVVEEPDDAFDGRMLELREWLEGRPESCIAIVSHWGCLYSLTGDHFDNCELRTTTLSSVLA